MFKKSVFDHEAIWHWNFPKAVSDEGRHQRESRERKSTEPPIEAGEDQRSADKFGNDRCERQWCRRREAELLQFGDGAREVDGLVEAPREMGRPKAEKCHPVQQRRSNPASNPERR